MVELKELLKPYVTDWFFSQFKDFTLPQKEAISKVLQGRNVLVTAPTGSGKTLAAFLGILNELFTLDEKKELKEGVYAIYISPLKALINDITKNLIVPLEGISKIAKEKYNLDLKNVTIGIRSGDTSSAEKGKQLRKPPKILCTTPENLAIALSSPKFRNNFSTVKWIIVDEIHSLAESKRGTHLTLSLERLETISPGFVRIGLSATIWPLSEIAKFLVGNRQCDIIDARFYKPIDIKIISPIKDLVNTPVDTITKETYKTITDEVKKHRTTLIFTNTRSGTERIVANLKKNFPSIFNEDNIGAHHSSVSRDIRLELEDKLKKGKLKAIVSSTSLELGIDIGYIDLVIQLGSPKSIARLLQRVGRAGHKLHETSRGLLICDNPDDLIEDSVMAKKAMEHEIDSIKIIKNALDVLSQHIVGMSLEKRWNLLEAYNVIIRAYPYHDLTWKDYLSVIKYLAGEYHSLEEKNVYSKIAIYKQEQENFIRVFDLPEITKEEAKEYFFGKKGTVRAIYYLNLGTIPDETKIKVYTIDKKFIGTLEEDFVQRLLPGDKFVLAGKIYSFIKRKGTKVIVMLSKEEKPTVPAWFSEELPLSFDLANWIRSYRNKMLYLQENKLKQFIKKEFNVNDYAVDAIAKYIELQRVFLDNFVKKKLSDKDILVEEYLSEGKRNIIFHTLFGRKVNDALSRAYAYKLSNEIGESIGIQINDNAFLLSFEDKTIPTSKIVRLVKADELEEILKKAVSNTELFKLKFRQNAARSFMILRNYKGIEIRVEKQQMNADKLLNAVMQFPEMPPLKETFREILYDYLDIEHAKQILEKIESNELRFVISRPLQVASPFSYNLITLGHSDIVLLEDRRRLIAKLYKELISKIDNGNI